MRILGIFGPGNKPAILEEDIMTFVRVNTYGMEYIQLGQKFLELFDELTACVVVPSVDRIRSIGFIGRTFRNAEKFF